MKRSLHVSLPVLPKTVIYLSPCHTNRTHTIESCSFKKIAMAFAFSALWFWETLNCQTMLITNTLETGKSYRRIKIYPKHYIGFSTLLQLLHQGYFPFQNECEYVAYKAKSTIYRVRCVLEFHKRIL